MTEAFISRPVHGPASGTSGTEDSNVNDFYPANHDKIYVLTDQGLLYLKLGNLDKAESSFDMALRYSVEIFNEAQKHRADSEPARQEILATADHRMNLALVKFKRGEQASALKMVGEVEQEYRKTGRDYDACMPRLTGKELKEINIAAFRQREIDGMLQQFKISESFQAPAAKN